MQVGENQKIVQARKEQTFPARRTGQTIDPTTQGVIRTSSPLVQQQNMEEAKVWAAEWGMSVDEILASQDELFPKAIVAPKPIFVMGEALVSNERLQELPTHMRYLHAWYLTAAKNGRIMIVLRVPEEYYADRHEEIHVEFEELF